jgi:hypothetical protein
LIELRLVGSLGKTVISCHKTQDNMVASFHLCARVHTNTEKSLSPGVRVHVYNPSTHKAKAGGWRVQDQPRLQIKTISKKKTKNS